MAEQRDYDSRLSAAEQAYSRHAGEIEQIKSMLTQLAADIRDQYEAFSRNLRETRRDLAQPKGQWAQVVLIVFGGMSLLAVPASLSLNFITDQITKINSNQVKMADQILNLAIQQSQFSGIDQERQGWVNRELDGIHNSLRAIHEKDLAEAPARWRKEDAWREWERQGRKDQEQDDLIRELMRYHGRQP